PDLVELLLKHGATPTPSALSAVTTYGHAKSFKVMLSKLTPAEIKRRPLLASIRGSLECAKIAVAMGADPNLVSASQTLSMDQQSALHETANCGRYDILHYYLSECGGDPDLRDSRGRTPLHSAAYGGHIECCKLLVEYGAKWSVADMRKRFMWGDDESIQLLVKFEMIPSTAVARHFAFIKQKAPAQKDWEQHVEKKKKLIEYLLANGLDAKAASIDGWTPLHLQAEKPDAASARLLVDAGADPNARDSEGCTPMHWAARPKNYHVARPKRLRMSAELISFLREKGADINARDITGAAPLHYAVWHNEDFVEILLNNGADPNVATLPACGQYTPLHFAADIRKKSAIKSLLEKGANPTRIDAEGRSVLHHIVKDCDVQFTIEDPVIPGEPLSDSLIVVGDLPSEERGGDEHAWDVLFDVQGQRIRANKSILSSRADYFNIMFMSQWRESDLGEIEIIDVEPDVFLHLLKFLYTHRLDADQELNLQLAVKLLLVADQFLLPSLQIAVQKYLAQNIHKNQDSFVMLWEIAEQFEFKEVKKACLKFILDDLGHQRRRALEQQQHDTDQEQQQQRKQQQQEEEKKRKLDVDAAAMEIEGEQQPQQLATDTATATAAKKRRRTDSPEEEEGEGEGEAVAATIGGGMEVEKKEKEKEKGKEKAGDEEEEKEEKGDEYREVCRKLIFEVLEKKMDLPRKYRSIHWKKDEEVASASSSSSSAAAPPPPR
ncbi:BTB/POZ domain containing protein, partial [Acanthamoeba castellanii str. Neff]